MTGTGDFDAVLAELDRIREDGVNAVIDAALQAHGAEAPVPPARRGGPAFYTTAIAAGPVESASDAENAALERLNQLRPLVYNPQPLTPQEVRTTIRRWIGDGLPAYAKALGDPVAMRAWVATQVRGPARRSAGMTYSTPALPGGRWYGGEPKGLLTATDVEDRAQVWNLVPWEEIPAWVQPGLTGSLRSLLLAAMPGKGNNEPGSLRDALDTAWAAIEAAPPPSPAELDDARRVYGGASPAQQPCSATRRRTARTRPGPPRHSRPARTKPSARPKVAGPARRARPDRRAARGTQPDQGGQAPQGADANDTQAPPAAASQEPSPDDHRGQPGRQRRQRRPAGSTSSARPGSGPGPPVVRRQSRSGPRGRPGPGRSPGRGNTR